MNSSTLPQVTFLASSLLGKVPLGVDWLDSPLPLDRSPAHPKEKSPWTYGQYFQIIKEVLSRDSYTLLLEAVREQLATSLDLSDLQELFVYAEKHGQFYHPAKIEVETLKGTAQFALNVALSEIGVGGMDREVDALRYLAANYPYRWIPLVYFSADSERNYPSWGAQGQRVSLFLADWMEGYEFHLSIDPEEGTQKILLWDGNPKPTFLSLDQSGQVYHQISKILTLYYNPRTYEQIFPWHHGAGDFVVKKKGKEIEIKLVTVRQYGSLMDPEEIGVEEAYLFFFLNLSLRMRLDRLDGVGEMVWAEPLCLEMTWTGFFQGIKIKEKEGVLFPGFQNSFLKWLRALSPGDLAERFSTLLGSYDPEAPDLSVIKENFVPHILGVYEIFKKL